MTGGFDGPNVAQERHIMANEELTKKYIKTMEEAGDAKKQKLRSPAYIVIGLREAIEKIRVIWEHEKRNEVAVDVVAGHWKVAPKSSATLMTISTLKKFELITDRGNGDQRYIKLTDLAYNILRADANTPAWLASVQKAALSPKIIAELWESDKENPRSTPSLKKYLEFEKHFNPVVIDSFIQSYRDTISFAKLGIGDKVVTEESASEIKEFSMEHAPEELKAFHAEVTAANEKNKGNKVLAQYSIPLGSNEATLVFKGDKLSADDFDALGEFVEFAKKQFERKSKSEEQATAKSQFLKREEAES